MEEKTRRKIGGKNEKEQEKLNIFILYIKISNDML